MKKFVKSIFLILIGAWLIIEICNFGYGFFYEESRMTNYDNPEFDEMPEMLTYVNVGSSHGAQSFRYAVLGDEIYSQAFNFGMGAQSYSYDYSLLQCYEEYISVEGGVLLVPVSIFSFYVDEQRASDYASKILRYYPVLDYQYIDGGNYTDYILYRYIYSRYPLLKLADKQIDTIFFYQNANIEFEDGRTQYDEAGYPILVQKNQDALRQIIGFGEEHNMRVVLITTPVQEEYYATYGEQYLEQFRTDVEAFVQETQVEYWNYEDLYFNKEEYFTDSNHLNEEGAAQFTKLVFERLLNE